MSELEPGDLLVGLNTDERLHFFRVVRTTKRSVLVKRLKATRRLDRCYPTSRVVSHSLLRMSKVGTEPWMVIHRGMRCFPLSHIELCRDCARGPTKILRMLPPVHERLDFLS